jgi:hypothetical protein
MRDPALIGKIARYVKRKRPVNSLRWVQLTGTVSLPRQRALVCTSQEMSMFGFQRLVVRKDLDIPSKLFIFAAFIYILLL